MTTKIEALDKARQNLKAAESTVEATYADYVLARKADKFAGEIAWSAHIRQIDALHAGMRAVKDAEIDLGRPDGE